jgi:hypothetical protein
MKTPTEISEIYEKEFQDLIALYPLEQRENLVKFHNALNEIEHKLAEELTKWNKKNKNSILINPGLL